MVNLPCVEIDGNDPWLRILTQEDFESQSFDDKTAGEFE